MDGFKPRSKDGQLFVLSNKGFHKVDYIDKFNQLSIDKLQDFIAKLKETFTNTVMKTHLDGKHNVD